MTWLILVPFIAVCYVLAGIASVRFILWIDFKVEGSTAFTDDERSEDSIWGLLVFLWPIVLIFAGGVGLYCLSGWLFRRSEGLFRWLGRFTTPRQ